MAKVDPKLYKALQKIAYGYEDVQTQQHFMTKGELRAKLAKNKDKPKKTLTEEEEKFASEDEKTSEFDEFELVCNDCTTTTKFHAPEPSAIKLLLEINEKQESENSNDIERFAKEIKLLSDKELIELRNSLLKRDDD